MAERIAPRAGIPPGSQEQQAEAAPRRRLRGLRVLSALFLIALFPLLSAQVAHAQIPEITVNLIPSPGNPNGDDPVQSLGIDPVEQAVLVSVVDENFFPIPDVEVAVTVTGPNAQPGELIETTDENGEAIVTYVALLPGTDTITARLVDDPFVEASVEKGWTLAPIVGAQLIQASASGVLHTIAGSRWPFSTSARFQRGTVGGSADFSVGQQNGLPAFRFTVPSRGGFGVTGMMVRNGIIVLLGRGLVYFQNQPRNPQPVNFRIQFLRTGGNGALVSILLSGPGGPVFELVNGQLQRGVVTIRMR